MVALITGSSRGIGAAAAVKLAEQGFDIAVVYRSETEKAAETATRCQQHHVQAAPFSADISREEDCVSLLEAVHEKLGPVNVLVNNAGITRDGLCLRMNKEQFTSVVDANLTGTFLMCRLVLPDMLKTRQGRIINLTSVAGLYGNAGQVNYAAAKAGIIGLTRSLAKEVASRQITVNAVAPGFIETDMTAKLPDKVKEQARQSIALGRFGQPEDVADLIAFLASPSAGYITGQVIEISGGLVL